MNINITKISNNIRMNGDPNTSRIFSGKIPQMRLEDGRALINPAHLRQKSASHQHILCDNGKNEDLQHCNRIKIRELILNEIQNECQINCRNLEKIKFLEKQIKDLLESNIYLKKINEYLIKSLTRKEELFLNVTNENKNLKFDNQLLNAHMGSKNSVSRERICLRQKSKKGVSNVRTSKITNNNGNGQNLNLLDGNNYNYNSNNSNANCNNFEIEEIMRKIKSEEIEVNSDIKNNNNNKNFIGIDVNSGEKDLDKETARKDKNRNSILSDINISEIKNNFNSNNNNKNNNNSYITNNAIKSQNRPKTIDDSKDFNKVKYLIDVGNKENITNFYNNNNNNSSAYENKKEGIKKNENANKEKTILHSLLNLANEETFGIANREKDSRNQISNINLRTLEFTHLNERIKNISKIFKNNEKQPEITVENLTASINPNNFGDLKNSKNENNFLKINNGFLSARNGSVGCNQLNSLLSFGAGNPRKTLVNQAQNQKQKNYYEKISGIMRKARIENHSKPKEENLISFFSVEKTNIEKLLNNRMFRKIKKLTHNENEFFEKVKGYDEEKLSGYFEMIASVSDNLQNAVSLILKIKTVLNKILLAPRIETKECLCAFFVSLLTEIFQCERALIYKNDEFSDKVTICAGKEEDPLNDLRVNREFGIIGHVLRNGEAMRIDEAALDPIFVKDRNNELLKAIKIKNLMCAPVKVYLEAKDESNGICNNAKCNKNSNDNLANNPKQSNNMNSGYAGSLGSKCKINLNNKNKENGTATAMSASVSLKITGANAASLLKTINSDYSNKAFDTIKSNEAKKAETTKLNTVKADKIMNNANSKMKKIENINDNANDSGNPNYFYFKTIGVLQIINKLKGNFTQDEQELLCLISSFFSLLWENISKSEFDSQQNSKLKIFCEFSSEKRNIKAKADITAAYESLLVSMFSGNCAQLLFYDDEIDGLRRITKYENKLKNKNVGIIGFVLENKEYYGCESIINCRHFSNLIDLETTCNLLTYPIFSNQKLIAVLQFGYNGKLCESKKPQDCDEALIGNVIKSILSWVIFVTENEIVVKEDK